MLCVYTDGLIADCSRSKISSDSTSGLLRPKSFCWNLLRKGRNRQNASNYCIWRLLNHNWSQRRIFVFHFNFCAWKNNCLE